MKKVLIMLILGAISVVTAENVPTDVIKVMNDFMSGNSPHSSTFTGMAAAWGLDSGTSTQLSDLKAGDPIHMYRMFGDQLKGKDANAPVLSIAIPMDDWYIPLLFQGKCVIMLEIIKPQAPFDTNWQFGACGLTGLAMQWDQVRKKWPKSSKCNPIIIEGPGGRSYFHIPEQGNNNLTELNHRFNMKSHDSIPDTLFGTLSSSSDIIKDLQKAYLKGPLRPYKGSGPIGGGGG